MTRGLDHVVHAVRDLDAAGAVYAGLGFTVGARNRHPWGTHNRIVQFPGAFIEPLTLAEPGKLGDDGFSKLFGAYTGEFLTRGEGLSLLILESADAAADAEAFKAAGIAGSDGALHFEREGRRPDGTAVKVGFSLAFAEDRHAPDIRFATCQQHYPENFWNPAFQKHGNGVAGIAGVVLVADAPRRQKDFLLAFSGAREASTTADGFAVTTPRGVIDVTTPAGFLARFGVPAPDVSRGARLAALRFTTADAGLAHAAPDQAGRQAGNARVVGPSDAMGAVLVFEPTG